MKGPALFLTLIFSSVKKGYQTIETWLSSASLQRDFWKKRPDKPVGKKHHNVYLLSQQRDEIDWGCCRSGVELPSSFNGDETEESSSSSMD